MILNIPQEIYNEFEPENVFNCLMNIDGQLYRNQASRKTSRIRIHGQDYFIKQHKGVGYIEIFKNLLRGRLPVIGAKNEWRAIELCDRLSIKTTPLVGYGASGWNVATAQSFVLTAPLENMQSLDHVFKKNMNFAKKRKIIAQLAKVVRAFHQAGMCHKDMYLCHFLLDEKTFCIYVMDLHRVTIQKKTI